MMPTLWKDLKGIAVRQNQMAIGSPEIGIKFFVSRAAAE
jgi:hypothetical protein